MNVEQALVEACMLTEAVSPDGDPRKVISDLIMWHILTDRAFRAGPMEFRSRPVAVCIRQSEFGTGEHVRKVDQVRVFLNEMWLGADLVDDRQVRLAHKLAVDNAVLFYYDEANAERCRRALHIPVLESELKP